MKPDWLGESETPGSAFRKLIARFGQELKGADQATKVDEFRRGIAAIQGFVGEITITREFMAAFPGVSARNIYVFVGKRGANATPLIAFDATGKIWTGSVERSLGTTPDGRPVFNAFKANLVAE
jgi:hypothetical protein